MILNVFLLVLLNACDHTLSYSSKWLGATLQYHCPVPETTPYPSRSPSEMPVRTSALCQNASTIFVMVNSSKELSDGAVISPDLRKPKKHRVGAAYSMLPSLVFHLSNHMDFIS